MKIAIIGTYPPRQCGIATFTYDLHQSLALSKRDKSAIVAISDGSEPHFPDEVAIVIERDKVESYIQAATLINHTFDVCIVQHEYGIFGGGSGDYILDLLRCLTIPVVSNLHTVLAEPSTKEREVLTELIRLSDSITVMTKHAIDILDNVYHISGEKIALIPHGVPQFDHQQEQAKKSLGLNCKKVMLSFGFLGRSKGFETAIEAVASVNDPDFVYIILGSTHPNVLRSEGETYRESLQQMTETLGIAHKVQFINSFASEKLLVQYLSACDIYVTPYPNKNQISSGTLSFAIGAGAAVISTPYWYAKDLLADDRGLLFDFKDTKGLATLINNLLENPVMLAKYRQNAANYGRHMSWPNVGKMQLHLLRQLVKVRKDTLQLPVPISDTQKQFPLLLTSQNKLSS
ncbi:MAG TPA: glycosyltransferase family 4 protein [Sphingobacterium sp.]|nr:glycosyltransferase family 4 protein [Sphingobacterium sp.]